MNAPLILSADQVQTPSPAPPASPAPAAAAARPIIRFEKVAKIFAARGSNAQVAALSDITLDVPEGAILGVIGRSGAGKSTLIRLVNGLERPSSGRVTVDGVDIGALDEKALRAERRSIGMIFQHFNLLARRTAFDNVALPLEIAGVPRREIKARVEPLLELVGLSDKRDRYPAELSGGQKQRVGIARALATRPRVLLSDEATSALDPETTNQILALLRKVNAELNLTVLLITHEMAVIKAVADRVAVIDGGRIVEEGATYSVFAAPQHATTRSFLSALTGQSLPPELADRLKPVPAEAREAVLRIVFTGNHASDPVLSRVSRLLSVDVNIIQAQVDEIAGAPFGVIIVSVPGDAATVSAVVNAVERLHLSAEVLGYV
ncbi:ABC transporter related [Xanthobacter versatilis]|uniref:Cell division ATP-binding protein FtsE n=1 Tax=Xanthobacter autotrophicus (strain ATCC BAA-1158 / Py2) TaxID=78245 RepID=A7IEF1_XANP2|nr:ABC transporter related [Xanthobacter autotrophicus Py2]